MSTILDALRRAETERGSPPGAALPPLGLAPAAVTERRGRGPLVAFATLAVLLAAAGFYAWRPQPAPPAALPVANPPAPSAVPAPSHAPAPAPLPAPAVLLQAPGARSLPAPAPAVPRAPASAAVPLPQLAELPAGVRQQLPLLKVGGSMHSPEPHLRSLIVNGQLYREGDEIAAGLRLEEIGLRAARLRFRGQGFELPY